MTVRVQGPSSRLSEELTKAKRKIGKFASTLLKSETEYDFQKAVQPAQMPLPFGQTFKLETMLEDQIAKHMLMRETVDLS